MDVMLIDNLFVEHGPAGPNTTFYPHLGLLSVAAELTEAGLTAGIFDPKMEYSVFVEGGATGDFDATLINAILSHAPKLVGFTAYGLNFHHVTVWVRKLRRQAPELKIALGGPHVSMMADQIVDFLPEVDLLVVGECEDRVAEVMEACLEGRPPRQGLARIRNQALVSEAGPQRKMAACKLPDLSLYVNAPPLDMGRLAFPLEAGRGCPYECTFCSTSQYFGRNYRVRSPEELVGDIRELRNRLSITNFDLTHDLFGLRKNFVREFCDQVRPLEVTWQCSMRPDQLSQEMVDMLVSAGCTDVYLGFETGSPTLQSSIKKRLDLVQSESAAQRLLDAGMGVTCSFITGFPDESQIDLECTLDLAGRLLQMSTGKLIVQLHLLAPEQGSELGQHSVGVLRFDGIGPDLHPVARPELVKSHPCIFANHFYLDSIAGRALHVQASVFVMQVLPAIGYSFAVWLVRQTAAGSLALLFKELLATLVTQRDAAVENLRASMIDACYRRAASHLGDEELLMEYARFREVVRYLSGRTGRPRLGTPCNDSAAGERSFEYTVSCDVISFVQDLDQGKNPPEVAGHDNRRWHLAVFQSGNTVCATSTLLAQSS